MLKLVYKLLTEEEGQGMTEYALVLGIISIATIALITIFSGQVQVAWTNKTNGLGTSMVNASSPAP